MRALMRPGWDNGSSGPKGKTVTLMQAFKVWWSYSWRASILVIPLAVIMTAISLAGLISTV
jgi:hypothetical protein